MDNMKAVNFFRRWSLAFAESFDAWRVAPRMLVTAYCYLIAKVIAKFMAFGVVTKVTCDSAVLQVLLDRHVDLASASNVACRVVDTLGPPTTYSAIVGAVLGIAAVVFSVYTNGGRDWTKSILPWKWGETAVQPDITNKEDESK